MHLLVAPILGASQARVALQTRPRGRGLGAFEGQGATFAVVRVFGNLVLAGKWRDTRIEIYFMVLNLLTRSRT